MTKTITRQRDVQSSERAIAASAIITDMESENDYNEWFVENRPWEAYRTQKRDGYMHVLMTCHSPAVPLPVQANVIECTTADNYRNFIGLMNSWRQERGPTSSITSIVTAPSYLRIIGMGEKVLPFIFQQLLSESDDPDHWFVALTAITGENPIAPDDYGDMPAMSKAWLKWADRNNAR